ncbi:hypothetical protein OO015_05095 [Thermomicrobium sp. 4228-Ro]|uniref:hypothetical protein n=1 Tax=Thermomicrobium sp. 4228-Ro TaxID=2993937 RepID=UPI002248F545|nr:hypothetical protein [Thermomicrobium sp. 4228-Ro]MCX2726868.1 hypothetical protein [Thermomicrobium sp. 4228-Ro]
MRVLGRLALAIVWLSGSATTWSLVLWLVITRNVGAIADFWAPERLLAYALFVAAPAFTFAPLARLARVPFLEIEAIAGWSTSLYVWTFIDPSRVDGALAMLVILLPLLVAISSVYTLLVASISRRIAIRRGQEPDPLVARRRGYVLGFFTVGCVLLQSLQALTALNAGLLGLIALFVELLAMTWFAPVRAGGEPGRGTSGNRRRWNEYGRGAPGRG